MIRINKNDLSRVDWQQVVDNVHVVEPVELSQKECAQRRGQAVHRHSFAEIVVCLHGNHGYGIDGRIAHLSPGSVLLIPALVEHDSTYNKWHGACIDFWVHFAVAGMLTTNTVECTDAGYQQCALAFPHIASGGLAASLVAFLQRYPCKQITTDARVEQHALALMTSFVDELATGDHDRLVADKHTVIATVKQYILDNLCDDLSLSGLAKVAGYSPFHFHRMFQQIEGMTVRRFVERQRLEHACHLLKSGQSVTAAALDSGFDSSSQFSRVFKRNFNVSPTEWLNQI